jgi:hypothetical protein
VELPLNLKLPPDIPADLKPLADISPFSYKNPGVRIKNTDLKVLLGHK